MPAYAAFIRGINLGRRRRVSSTELRSAFEALGFQGVSTFRTSGNVVFECGGEAAAEITRRIETALAESLGYDVAVFLRTAGQIRQMAGLEPFAATLVDASEGKLQVLMLSAKPAARARDEVLAGGTEEDRLAFGDQELYWLPSGGTRESAFDVKAVEQLLGPITMRTKGTIEQLAAKYCAG